MSFLAEMCRTPLQSACEAAKGLSLDGRAFVLQAPVEGLDLQVGGYAVVETSGGPLVGQIVSLELSSTSGPDLVSADGSHRTTVRIRAVVVTGGAVGDILETTFIGNTMVENRNRIPLERAANAGSNRSPMLRFNTTRRRCRG